MPEKRLNYIQDHDLLIRVDENVKNLVSELKSLKEIDIKELREGTKADIEMLKLTKAEKGTVDTLTIKVDGINQVVIKYVAYATAGIVVFQIILAVLIKKFV